MNGRTRHPLAACLALACLLNAAAATGQPDTGVIAPSSAPPVQPAKLLPVPPDTVLVDLDWPPAGGGVLVDMEPESLLFGGTCRLVFTGLTEALPDSLPVPSWIVPGAIVPVADPAGAQALELRVYRLGWFRVRSGGETSPAVLVGGRLTDINAAAPVRAPRSPGWNLRFILAVVAMAGVLAVVAWWLARRRWGSGPLGRDRKTVPAAWPRTAAELEDLLAGGLPAGGERDFLDGFTALVRAHVARRFLVHGREMTADEIAAACADLGYEQPAARPFVRLLADVDRRRYDPEPVSEAFCREQVARFLEAVAAVRIAPAAGSLPHREIQRGETAWRRLRSEFTANDGGGE
ncbi:MAG: hypothetical protein GY838_17710 [bacterium]|nr:hypothetical protein [bacterium]